MWKKRKVSVVFPAYNEEKNIARAIKDFRSTQFADEIVIIDNNSTDETADIARKHGARVVQELRQGFGYAVRRALRAARGEYIILCEPDGTFSGSDLLKFLSYADDFDLVLGTRTTRELIWDAANMGWFLRIGNIVVAKMIEFLFGGPSLSDCGCTYRLIRRDALKKIQSFFTVGGSHFLPEMVILTLGAGFRVVEIPVNYKARIGISKITGSRWKAFLVGLQMILLILRYRLSF